MLNYLFPLVFANIIFGLVPILDKKSLMHYPSIEKYSILRLLSFALFSCIVVFGYGLYKGIGLKDLQLKNGNMEGLKYLLLVSFLNAFAFIFFFIYIKEGKHTGAINLIGMGIALSTSLILSYYYLGQRLKPGMGVSLLIITIGIVMTLYFSNK